MSLSEKTDRVTRACFSIPCSISVRMKLKKKLNNDLNYAKEMLRKELVKLPKRELSTTGRDVNTDPTPLITVGY